MRHRYTEEQKQFIKEIAPGRYNDEITELFNKKFGTNLTENQIKAFKANHGIKSNVKRGKGTKRLFTKEQHDFIVRNVKGRTNQELADLVNERFGLSITERQINTYKTNNALTSGLDFRFKKGHSPWNKGVKGLDIGGKATRFKKGHVPLNYKPVGSERIAKDGYIEIKVADPNKWRLKHNVIWEKANGPIPKGHAILFADGNKRNLNLNNLLLVSRRQLAVLNKNHLLKDDAELTKIAIAIADLKLKISEKEKENDK